MVNADVIIPRAEDLLNELAVTKSIRGESLDLYNAGIDSGKIRFGLFARDLLISAFMLTREEFLRNVVSFCFSTQGEEADPETGEEPGRVIHEYESVHLRGLITRYNAADTTQLAIIGLESMLANEDDLKFGQKWAGTVKRSLDYLIKHMDNGLFWEDPSFCGAKRYALRSTYWKDDKLPGRENPCYPVAYSLLQAQTVAALRAAARLTEKLDIGYGRGELQKYAGKLVNSMFALLWDDKANYPAIALDQSGLISGISSDGVHMLYYLDVEDVPQKKTDAIFDNSRELITPHGYRTYAPGQPEYAPDSYHLGSIWPFEQYFIASGGVKFGKDFVCDVASRVLQIQAKHGFYELFGWDGDELKPLGCEKQLWSACLPLGMKGCDLLR